MNLELEQIHSNFWCFQCETSSNTLTDKSTCNKCDSDAIEQITLQNDPRKHSIPVVSTEQPEQNEYVQINFLTQTIDLGGSNVVVTVLNGPLHNLASANREGSLSILRMLSSMMGRGENEDTPASQSQIQSLQKISSVQCSVCQQDGGQGLKLKCNHSFHKDCILPWFQRKNTCPCCRNQLS